MSATPPAPRTVADGAVVAIYYTLRDDRGQVLDTNRRGGKPLAYLQGAGNLVPGLERQLLGRAKGETVQVVVEAAEGYGEHQPDLLEAVPRDRFPGHIELKAGMALSGRSPDGRSMQVRVHAVEGDQVTIDKNHPLAGQRLHFEVTIDGLRAATAEEREHGHVHGPGGHHHH